jgi:ferric-chelate reductase
MAQFPLLLLLAGKNNLIGLFVGVSYERLQVLHRWVARGMLLTATMHGGFQAYGWKRYGVLQIEIDTDSCIPTGELHCVMFDAGVVRISPKRTLGMVVG